MTKKSSNEKSASTAQQNTESVSPETAPTRAPLAKAKKASSTAKKNPAAPRKKAASKPPAAKRASSTAPTDDEIRLRAYFISERRMRLGLAGDSSTDWLEACRQLSRE